MTPNRFLFLLLVCLFCVFFGTSFFSVFNHSAYENQNCGTLCHVNKMENLDVYRPPVTLRSNKKIKFRRQKMNLKGIEKVQ